MTDSARDAHNREEKAWEGLFFVKEQQWEEKVVAGERATRSSFWRERLLLQKGIPG